MWLNDMGWVNMIDEQMDILKSELWERLFRLTSENKSNPNCIDGRDTDHGRPSIPGGKFGALGVVFATIDSLTNGDYDREGVIKIVKEFFNWKLGGHSDTHKQSKTPGCECDGCGHVYRLLHEWQERYNLHSSSIESLGNEIASIDNTEIDILEGNHEERSVIIVNHPGYGVKSHSSQGQDFVYNVAYVTDLYKHMSGKLSYLLKIPQHRLVDALLEQANTHVMTTAWDLAKWLPVFQVSWIDIDNDGNFKDCTIKHIMDVPE